MNKFNTIFDIPRRLKDLLSTYRHTKFITNNFSVVNDLERYLDQLKKDMVFLIDNFPYMDKLENGNLDDIKEFEKIKGVYK